MSLIVFVGIVFGASSANAQERKIVQYKQSVKTQTDVRKEFQPIESKEQRVNSKAGSIRLIYEDNLFPDSMLVSIRAAVEIWEAKLCNKQPIFLYLNYYDLNDDNLSMLCDVVYFESSDGSLPSALKSQIINDDGGVDAPDAMISFNSAVKWNCNHNSQSNINGVNVFSSMMRAVALSLGFGTSATVFEDVPGVVFPTAPYISRFDSLIRSNTGIWMKDLKSGSRELSDFMSLGSQSGCVIYAYKDETPYKLYSPRSYELGKSLVYLDNPNSLMHYDFGIGDKRFQIDNTTIELLNAVGWNIAPNPSDPTLEIISTQLDETGLGSAYENYIFIVKNNSNKKITNPRWTYKLFDKESGAPITIQTATSDQFEIQPVLNPGNFYLTTNGDLKGEINFQCTIDGVEYSAHPYIVSLELKPIIKAISDIEIIDHPHLNSRSVLCKVTYTGADYIVAAVEEDYSSSIVTYHINEPFLAHLQIDNITLRYSAWIDIKVSNKYGSTMETIELSPTYIQNSFAGIEDVGSQYLEDEKIEIFNLEGVLIDTVNSIEDVYTTLASGIYIIRIKNGYNPRIIQKIII